MKEFGQNGNKPVRVMDLESLSLFDPRNNVVEAATNVAFQKDVVWS